MKIAAVIELNSWGVPRIMTELQAFVWSKNIYTM